MAAEERFDLVVLGSGSTAFAAALRAQELGKTAVMTEERTLGGTCVNRGCLPSKNLIEAAQLVHDAAHPRYPGLRPATLEVDFPALVQQKDDVIAGYRQRKYESLLGGQFRLERGHAEFINAHTVEVNGKRLVGGAILIATGSRPVLPEINGLAEVPYLTSDLLTSGEEVELEELPKSLLIVGAGYIALELGQMFRRLGSAVTILERSPELLSHGYEPEVGPAVRRIFEQEGIEVLRNAVANEVRADRGSVVATVRVDGKPREIRAERLLVATGRRPNTDQIAVGKAGVALGEHGQVIVDEHLRTNVPHIFAAGDVVGPRAGEPDGDSGRQPGRRHRGAQRALRRAPAQGEPPRHPARGLHRSAAGHGRDVRGASRPGGTSELVPSRPDVARAARGRDPGRARLREDGRRPQDGRGPRRDDARSRGGGGHPRGGDGAALSRAAPGLHRPPARLPDDGRGAEDRGHLAVQGPRQAVLLRGVGARAGRTMLAW
jgi:pyruvate/2-oxoglutarate dehydrogenase complex dihydrolipoamide dehydrogenase (E3) component